MTNKTLRSKRLRKKLYLEEFAILGFEFSYTINLDSAEEYETFFEGFILEKKNYVKSVIIFTIIIFSIVIKQKYLLTYATKKQI